MKEVRKEYDEAFRRYVVEEIESGRMSRADVRGEYGVNKSLIGLWLEDYGKFKPKRDIVEVVMKSEEERITELEKALADAHLKNRIYEEIINLAGKEYKTDLKKTFGTRLSEDSKGTGTRSKRSAKHSDGRGVRTTRD